MPRVKLGGLCDTRTGRCWTGRDLGPSAPCGCKETSTRSGRIPFVPCSPRCCQRKPVRRRQSAASAAVEGALGLEAVPPSGHGQATQGERRRVPLAWESLAPACSRQGWAPGSSLHEAQAQQEQLLQPDSDWEAHGTGTLASAQLKPVRLAEEAVGSGPGRAAEMLRDLDVTLLPRHVLMLGVPARRRGCSSLPQASVPARGPSGQHL